MTLRVPFLVPPATSHNFPPYLLSDTDDLLGCEVNTTHQVQARTLTLTECSENVTKSIIVSAASPDSEKFRAMSARALRLVTLRVPKALMPHAHVPSYLLAYVTETLECGHQLDFYPVADPLIARRRNCPQCAGVAHKKPPQSVTALRERKAA